MEKLISLRVVSVLLAGLAALAYFNAASHPFVHDDIVFILQNENVHHLRGIMGVFGQQNFPIPGENSAVANPYWRPMLDIVYRIEYGMFGTSSAGYHLINIILHGLNAVLVYVLSLRLTRRSVFSLCCAAVFIVHPIQSEAVACISGISNVLFTFFSLASFLQYVKAHDDHLVKNLDRSSMRYVCSLLLFLIALLSKEQAIVLLGMIGLYEFCFLRGTPRFSFAAWRRLAGFGLVTGGYLVWRKMILGGFATEMIGNIGEFYLRLRSLPGMILAHIRTIFLPVDLHYYRSYDILAPWFVPCLIFSLLIVLCFYIYQCLPSDRRPLFSFGWGWFLLTLSPTTSLVPLFHEYSLIAAFEHFLYLPLVGVLWSVGVAVDYFMLVNFKDTAGKMRKTLGVLLIAIGIVLTFNQHHMWSGEIPLFEKAVKYEPHMGRLRILLGKAYLNQHDIQKAEQEFVAARDIMAGYLGKIKDQRVRPFYLGFLKESFLGLAACAEATGRYAQAKEAYERILAFSPTDSMIYNNLGVLAIRLRKNEEAMIHFKKALEYDPKFSPARHNLETLQHHSQQP